MFENTSLLPFLSSVSSPLLYLQHCSSLLQLSHCTPTNTQLATSELLTSMIHVALSEGMKCEVCVCIDGVSSGLAIKNIHFTFKVRAFLFFSLEYKTLELCIKFSFLLFISFFLDSCIDISVIKTF